MIITNDEIFLRRKCEDVKLEEVDGLISSLEKELDKSAAMGRPGIGLAANQIGISKKAAIIRINNNGLHNLSINLINAKIEGVYGEFIFKEEGCLSFPNRLENTKRYNEIYVVNNLVRPHSFIATDLVAVAIQHELDHLNGIIFFDNSIKHEIRKKVRPNERCYCGSGKKYKKCHMEIKK